MRINDRLTSTDRLITESRRFLEGIIEGIRYNPPAPAYYVPEDVTDENVSGFFQDYYVPLDSRGHTPSDCEIPGVILSSYEQKLIDFCRNPKSETRTCVVHGHTGVGKTSLLRRLFYYLYPKCPSLKSSFYPIYIRMTQNLLETNPDPDKVYAEIVKIVCESCYRIIKKELETDRQRILEDLNIKSGFWGRFSDADIEAALQSSVEDWLNSRFGEPNLRNAFVLDLLALLIRQGRQRVILVVDDVDRFSADAHNCMFLALDSLTSRGIASIVCMRTSTFQNTSAELLEYRDQQIVIQLNPDLIRQILQRRVDLLRDSVRLHPETPFRIRDYEEVSGVDVVNSFCDLLSRQACMNSLISLSNTDLKSVFLKLDLMCKSEAFSDTFIVHQLLERHVLGTREPPTSKIWVFYHLLLGNYAGTYRRDPQARKAGLINVFDSSEPSENPWRHFIRINLMLYLFKIWRLTRDEDQYVDVSEVQEKFKRTFGTTVGMSLLVDAMWALIESELVFMQSCRRYTDKAKVIQHVFSDSVRLSDAGRFYLENLLHKVEYLYFIKDDIDWSDETQLGHLTPASRDYFRPAKFVSVLQALRFLADEEYRCLARLKAHWSGSEEYEDALGRYRDQFSPHGLADSNTISICEVILGSYTKFIRQRLGTSYPGSDADQLIRQIETLRGENVGITKAFLQA
jgi:hypothetical protein